MKTKIFLRVILFLISFVLYSCEKEQTDIGKFYEGQFNDEFLIVDESDTINISFEQYEPETHIYNKPHIPYSIENKDTVSDLITLKLFVLYGSYYQSPIIYKDANKISDTLYLWYSDRGKLSNALHKSNFITESNTSPRLAYTVVDSIVIQKGRNKSVNLNSRLLHL